MRDLVCTKFYSLSTLIIEELVCKIAGLVYAKRHVPLAWRGIKRVLVPARPRVFSWGFPPGPRQRGEPLWNPPKPPWRASWTDPSTRRTPCALCDERDQEGSCPTHPRVFFWGFPQARPKGRTPLESPEAARRASWTDPSTQTRPLRLDGAISPLPRKRESTPRMPQGRAAGRLQDGDGTLLKCRSWTGRLVRRVVMTKWIP